MKTQTISFEQWRREAPQLRAKSAEPEVSPEFQKVLDWPARRPASQPGGAATPVGRGFE
jgi:hypothetical protein